MRSRENKAAKRRKCGATRTDIKLAVPHKHHVPPQSAPVLPRLIVMALMDSSLKAPPAPKMSHALQKRNAKRRISPAATWCHDPSCGFFTHGVCKNTKGASFERLRAPLIAASLSCFTQSTRERMKATKPQLVSVWCRYCRRPETCNTCLVFG